MNEQEIQALRQTLGTLINWMAQSANSPISGQEASQLLNMLYPTDNLEKPV